MMMTVAITMLMTTTAMMNNSVGTEELIKEDW